MCFCYLKRNTKEREEQTMGGGGEKTISFPWLIIPESK